MSDKVALITGVTGQDGAHLARVDPRYFRPTEVEQLLGDPSKAHKKLGWRHKTSFKELVTEMVQSDLKVVAQEQWRNDPGAH